MTHNFSLGSHGEGSAVETETPFVAWGAGILEPTVIERPQKQPEEWQLSHLQRDDLNQTDIAPLMSILLGIPIPVNSLVRFAIILMNQKYFYQTFKRTIYFHRERFLQISSTSRWNSKVPLSS